jgi:hypothetical protein
MIIDKRRSNEKFVAGDKGKMSLFPFIEILQCEALHCTLLSGKNVLEQPLQLNTLMN